MIENEDKIDDVIYNAVIVSLSKIQNVNYENIMVSVSGGSDSDILVDIFSRLDKEKKVKYVFFDTGIEYEATKRHIEYLKEKYQIEIEIIKSYKSVPAVCKLYGQPFISKQASEFIKRLQRHNFKWEDKPYEVLIKEYPNCVSALKWWCNQKGKNSSFNISRNKYLKEFMIAHPPTFKISNMCCHIAKDRTDSLYKKNNNIQLCVTGLRKAEGGTRASAYKNCFTSYDDKSDEFRPIYWFKNDNKKLYEKVYNIIHSDCYVVYGLKRTGCAGCPYGLYLEYELEALKEYEPKLYKAVCHIFKDSYEYTRAYKKFVEEMREKDETNTGTKERC